jgi:hypothetical protein
VEEKKTSIARLQHLNSRYTHFHGKEYTHATGEELLEAVFSVGSAPRLYKEASWTSMKEYAGRQANPYLRLLRGICPLAEGWEVEESTLLEAIASQCLVKNLRNNVIDLTY